MQDTFKNGRLLAGGGSAPPEKPNEKSRKTCPMCKMESEENAGSSRSAEMENETKKLKEEIVCLQKEVELEKKTNTALDVQLKELKEKISNDATQKELETNYEVIVLNKKLTDFQGQIEKMTKEHDKKLAENKKKTGKNHIYFKKII